MTPVPKNLNKKQVANWRRKVAAGWNPATTAKRIKAGYKNRDN
jgi:hypothetical protein